MLEQGIADKQYFMEKTHASEALEERSTLEEFVKDCILWEGLHAEAGKSMWKKEQQSVLWTNSSPYSPCHCATWGSRKQKSQEQRSEVEPREKKIKEWV